MLRLSTLVSIVVLAASTTFFPACAADETVDETNDESEIVSADLSAKTERSLAQRLPTTPELETWYASVEELEAALASGDPRYSLEPHRGGGTSAYVEVKRDGKTIGAWLPENSATVPLGEIRAFQLARALGVAPNVGRGTFCRLKGVGLQRLTTIMQGERYNGAKEENRAKLVQKLSANPASMLGVYKDWSGPRPIDYESLARGGSPNGKINSADPFVKLMAGEGRPSSDPVALPGVSGGKAPQVDLVKQLSTLMLIDALNGQWDRFSGGNMHVFVEGGVARFVTLDNGGVTTSGTGLAATYRNLILTQWVKRFDRSAVQRILELSDVATGAAASGLGFTSKEALRDALMMSDREWSGFAAGLAQVAQAVRAAGESSYL